MIRTIESFSGACGGDSKGWWDDSKGWRDDCKGWWDDSKGWWQGPSDFNYMKKKVLKNNYLLYQR